MRFFVGLHQPSDAKHFTSCFMSVNRVRPRRSEFTSGEWILDSGAFTEISKYGRYRHSVDEYAEEIKRWSKSPGLLAAVAQDWMCEPDIIHGNKSKKIVGTGLSVPEHQRRTIDRYDALTQCDVGGTYIMPVLQGYTPQEYVKHAHDYGKRIAPGMWVGVGSVCKRNGDPTAIEAVLLAVRRALPDVKIHGFGLKMTALKSRMVRQLLHTADSMAWSYSARKQGRRANDWREAAAFVAKIRALGVRV